MTVRIVMWSGPRNISTAMMRSFENRPDCVVSDEPFYGSYLARTGIDHPMREEIMADMECAFASVADSCAGPPPDGKAIWYQKHMTHHMLPGDRLDWADGAVNCFLIRNPAAVVASYAAKRAEPTPDDIGLDREAEIFEQIRARTGRLPPVLDADDVLRDPSVALRALCAACGIAFSDAMLSWPAGRRPSDGVWAAHWYGAVEASTGFAPLRPVAPDLPAPLDAVARAARPAYDALAAHRIAL